VLGTLAAHLLQIPRLDLRGDRAALAGADDAASSSRMGATSAAVPVKKAFVGHIHLVARDALLDAGQTHLGSELDHRRRVMPSRQAVRSGVYSFPRDTMKMFSALPSAT